MGEKEGLTPTIHTTHPKAVSPAQDWVLSSLGRKWAWQRSGEWSGPGVGKQHHRGYIQSQLACVSRFHWNTRGHGLTSCLREHLQPTPQSWLHRHLCWAPLLSFCSQIFPQPELSEKHNARDKRGRAPVWQGWGRECPRAAPSSPSPRPGRGSAEAPACPSGSGRGPGVGLILCRAHFPLLFLLSVAHASSEF